MVWFALYAALVRWTLRRAGPASKASSDARSPSLGAWWTPIPTSIPSSFSPHDNEVLYAKESIEAARQTFFREMRVVTKMDLALTFLNACLIVSVTGWAILLWYQGAATVGVVAGPRRLCCA